MSSTAALHLPRLHVGDADTPAKVILRSPLLRGSDVHTERCVGCGADHPPAERWRHVLVHTGPGWMLLRVVGGIAGVFLWAGALGLEQQVLRPSPSGERFLLVSTTLLTIVVVRQVLRWIIPRVETAFRRCPACRRRERRGWALQLLVAAVSAATPLVASPIVKEGYRGWGLTGGAAFLLVAASGVMMVLWLRPVFRAGQRRRWRVLHVDARHVVLQVPPTVERVLRAERPELFAR